MTAPKDFRVPSILTETINANGSFGNTGEVLTSGGVANVYWATAANGGGGGNAYGTVEVSGQANLVAPITNSIFTVVAGNGIILTTNVASDGALHVIVDEINLNVNSALFANQANAIANTANLTFGNITTTGFVNVGTNVEVAGEANIVGSATIGGILTTSFEAEGSSTLNVAFITSLEVTNNSILGGDTNVFGTLEVSGNSSLNNTNVSGNLIVTGQTTLKGNVITTGFINVGTTLQVTGNTSLVNVTAGVWEGSPVGPVYGGTGLSSYNLGDMLYASNTNILSTLPGNITTTMKFLTQTGNGVNSAAPSWSTVPTVGSLVFFFYDLASDITDYYQMKTPASTGANQSFTTAGLANGNTILVSFATLPDVPGVTFVPAGVVTCYITAEQTVGTQIAQLFATFYQRDLGGDETLIATSALTIPLTSANAAYIVQGDIPSALVFLSTDRIVTKVEVQVSGSGTSPTVVVVVEGLTAARTEAPSATVDATNFVPYTGALYAVNLNSQNLVTSGVVTSGNVTVVGFVNIGTSLQVNTTFTVNSTGYIASYGQGAPMQPASNVALAPDYGLCVPQFFAPMAGVMMSIGAGAYLQMVDIPGSTLGASMQPFANVSLSPNYGLVLPQFFAPMAGVTMFIGSGAYLQLSDEPVDTGNTVYEANGSIGVLGQVLTSAGVGQNTYWSTIASGGTYGTIGVAGQANLVAATTNSIFTIVAGNGIILTTNVSSDGALHVTGLIANSTVQGDISNVVQSFAGVKTFTANTISQGSVTANATAGGFYLAAGCKLWDGGNGDGYFNIANNAGTGFTALLLGPYPSGCEISLGGAGSGGALTFTSQSGTPSNVSCGNIIPSQQAVMADGSSSAPSIAWEVHVLGFFRVATGALSFGGHGAESIRMDTGTSSGTAQLSLLTANGLAMSLNVAGLSQLTGNATFSGFANIAATLQVAGLTTLNGNLTVGNTTSTVGFINLESANGVDVGCIIGFTKFGQSASYITHYNVVFGGTSSDLLIYPATGNTQMTGGVVASGNVVCAGLGVALGTASPGNVLDVKAAANAHITFGAGVSVPTAAAIIVLNDAYNANEPLEFRSTSTYMYCPSGLTVTGVTTFLSPPILPSGTVASFTSPVTGMLAFITDATSNPVFHGSITGGGAFFTPACYNGISWICI